MSSRSGDFSFEIPSDVFFGFMAAVLALMVLAATGAIVVRTVRTWQPKYQFRAVNDLSRKMNLTVPDNLREPLAHAIAVRKRGAEVASLIGLVSVGLVLWLVLWPSSESPQGFNSALLLLLIAGPGLFITVGAAIGGLLARRETPGKARAARLTPLTYRDLVAPVEQYLLVISVACAIVFPSLLLAGSVAPWAGATSDGVSGATMFFAAGLAVGALWLAIPGISRKLVATQALTGDEHALAWSDALAARIVRDLTHFTMGAAGMTALFSFMWLGLTLPQEWTGVSAVFPTIVMFIGVAVFATGVIIVDNRKPERHVQRTLWPQFAADGP